MGGGGDQTKKNQETITRAYVSMRRESVRDKLFHLYLPFYDDLCAELEDTFWAPYSSFRSLEEQLKLYNKGRTQESRARGEAIVTRARPGDSPHNWGCATDWAEFRPEFVSQEIWNKADWKVFGQAVESVGLEWGGSWLNFMDKPHAELKINCRWAKIGQIYRDQGIIEAEAAIEEAFTKNLDF